MVKKKVYMNVAVDEELFHKILEELRNGNGVFRNRSHFIEMAIREKLKI